MIDITIVDQKEEYALSVRTNTNLENLPNVIGENFMKVLEYMESLNEEIDFTGLIDCPFVAYHNMDMENIDLDIGIPIQKKLASKGDIKLIKIPEEKAIVHTHKGPYSELEAPYEEIMEWVENSNYELTGTFYECYYNSPEGPEAVPESELLTKLIMPIK